MTILTKLQQIENDANALANSPELQSEIKSMNDDELIEFKKEIDELDKECDSLCDLIDKRIEQLDAQDNQ